MLNRNTGNYNTEKFRLFYDSTSQNTTITNKLPTLLNTDQLRCHNLHTRTADKPITVYTL